MILEQTHPRRMRAKGELDAEGLRKSLPDQTMGTSLAALPVLEDVMLTGAGAKEPYRQGRTLAHQTDQKATAVILIAAGR